MEKYILGIRTKGVKLLINLNKKIILDIGFWVIEKCFIHYKEHKKTYLRPPQVNRPQKSTEFYFPYRNRLHVKFSDKQNQIQK